MRFIRDIALILVASGLVIGCWSGFAPSKLSRPLEVDELITLQYYTLAGLEPSAVPRRLDHISELRSMPGLTGLQFMAGLYCNVGRWAEPNNHVLNSMLIGVSLALGGRDERAVRRPALMGSLAFATVIYVLTGPILGWRAAAPLVVVWACFHPYVIRYGLTARGYSWMLALQVLQIILAYRLARSGRYLLVGVLGAAVAIVSVLNVVSMAVDWVLPFYFSLLLVRPDTPTTDPGARSAWRRSVIAQALAVFGMGAVFLLCNLAAVYSSANQYGIQFDSPGSFLATASDIFGGLFPGVLDKCFAMAGLSGLAAMALARQNRFLVVLAAMTLGVSLLHYAASGRFPYARAAGHVIPLVVLGAAFLTEQAIRIYDRFAGRAAMFGLLATLTAFYAVMPRPDTMSFRGLSERLELARQVEVPEGSEVFLTIQDGVDYIAAFYAPESWRQVRFVRPNQDLSIIAFLSSSVPDRLGPSVPAIDLQHLSGRTRELDEAALSSSEWIFWYPDFLGLGLDASEQRAFAESSGCVHLTQHDWFLVKMDVSSNVLCFIFMPTSDANAVKCEKVVREGLRRFGGSAVVFVPSV